MCSHLYVAVYTGVMDTKPLEELIIDSNNPKTLSDFAGNNLANSMTKYGDLSPVVFNRKLNKLVGGNSRVNLFLTKLIGNNRVVYTTKYDVPDEQGTVALGHIWHGNTPFAYREVEFNEVTHREANIAASVIHGDLVDQLLAESNQFIMENNGDVFATGQSEDDINKLLESFGSGLELENTEPEKEKQAKHDDGMKRLQAKFMDEQMLTIDEAIMLMKRDRVLTNEVNSDLTANALYYICKSYVENITSQNDAQTQETIETPPAGQTTTQPESAGIPQSTKTTKPRLRSQPPRQTISPASPPNPYQLSNKETLVLLSVLALAATLMVAASYHVFDFVFGSMVLLAFFVFCLLIR